LSNTHQKQAFDGAPSDNLYAVDIANHWDVGYSMFNDRQTFLAHFIEADIVHPNPNLTSLSNTVDIIYISKVFHQWDWETQLAALRSTIAFSGPSSMVVGFHAAAVGAGLKIWEEVGRETGTEWDAGHVVLRDITELANSPESLAYLDENCRLMDFVVTRIK
jgi:hypothetical protein